MRSNQRSSADQRLAITVPGASILILLAAGRFVDWNSIFLKGNLLRACS